MNELESILGYCGITNPPGANKIEYISTSWIDMGSYEELISDAGLFIGTVPLLAGFDWLTMPNIPTQEPWTTDQRSGGDGPYYDQTVKGVTPLLRPAVSVVFNKMANHRFLVRLKDKQGQQWLIGTPENPLDFGTADTVGTPQGGLNSYTFSFSGLTPKRAYGIA